MKLSEKTFLYSILLGGIMVVLLVGYFTLMLPSLYVDYVQRANLESAIEIGQQYEKEGSYDHLEVRNPTSTFTVEMPLKENKLKIVSKFFEAEVEVKDKDLQSFIQRFKDFDFEKEDIDQMELKEEDIKEVEDLIQDKLLKSAVLSKEYPLEIKATEKNSDSIYVEEEFKVHPVTDDLVVFEFGISDESNHYTTYVAMSQNEEKIVMTILPMMSSDMNEIAPVIIKSIPMIVAVVFFLVLVASQLFSRKIVNPIIRLAYYARGVKTEGQFHVRPFKIKEKDEIGELAATLNELYEKLQKNYWELEEKNNLLLEENKRQEVFMRASSHQLKTPITAALLLVEGMIGQIGKYKDTKEYLPEVKKQLKSMQKIGEDILYLNHCADHLQREEISLLPFVTEVTSHYQVQLEEKNIRLEQRGEGCAFTDGEILKKIVDNLISNAVQYTKNGEKIIVSIKEKQVMVENYGSHIEEDLLPNIYEPFVSSDTKNKGKGLGLYVVSYYVKLIGETISIENTEYGVRATLSFPS